MTRERAISYPGGPVRRTPDVVAMTQQMVQIPSNNGTEAVVSYLEEQAGEYGLQTFRVPTRSKSGRVMKGHPNLVVATSADMPKVMGEAHVDTVHPWPQGKAKGQGEFDPFGGTISDGKVYGLGATDALGSAAALFTAIAETGKGGAVFSADEEHGLHGIQSVSAELVRSYPGQSPLIIIAGGSNEGYATGTRGVLEIRGVIEGPSLHTSRPRDWVSVREGQRRVLDRVAEVTAVEDHPVLGRGNLEVTVDNVQYFDGKRLRKPTNQTANRGEFVLGYRENSMLDTTGQHLTGPHVQEIVDEELALINETQPDHKLRLTRFQTLAHIAAAVSDPERTRWIVELVEGTTGRNLVPWDLGNRGLEQAIILAGAFSEYEPDLLIVGPGIKELYHEPDEHVEVKDLEDFAYQIYPAVFADPRCN